MKVVGVGCGPGMLTEEAIRAISGAREILGSKRAIALAAVHIPAGCLVREMTVFRPEVPIRPGAVILSTGDPQLAGLGYLGEEIVPGISSLQVAAARLRVPLEQVSIVAAHGKDHSQATEEVAAELGRGRLVFIIADPKFSLDRLAASLAGSVEGISVAICEDLGYPGERIRIGSLSNPPAPASSLFSVMVGRIGLPPGTGGPVQ